MCDWVPCGLSFPDSRLFPARPVTPDGTADGSCAESGPRPSAAGSHQEWRWAGTVPRGQPRLSRARGSWRREFIGGTLGSHPLGQPCTCPPSARTCCKLHFFLDPVTKFQGNVASGGPTVRRECAWLLGSSLRYSTALGPWCPLFYFLPSYCSVSPASSPALVTSVPFYDCSSFFSSLVSNAYMLPAPVKEMRVQWFSKRKSSSFSYRGKHGVDPKEFCYSEKKNCCSVWKYLAPFAL